MFVELIIHLGLGIVILFVIRPYVRIQYNKVVPCFNRALSIKELKSTESEKLRLAQTFDYFKLKYKLRVKVQVVDFELDSLVPRSNFHYVQLSSELLAKGDEFVKNNGPQLDDKKILLILVLLENAVEINQILDEDFQYEKLSLIDVLIMDLLSLHY